MMVFEPHGFARLTKYIGDELDIVNAARVSLAKESEAFDTSDAGLIRFLMRERHGSPFEHGFLSMWHIRMPIFVMREWVRHRIGHSVNEESGRYVELRPDFYIPERLRTQTGRPGAYRFEEIGGPPELIEGIQTSIADHSECSYRLYESFLAQGLAKEQARIVLPLNLYTEIRWTANARSLMNFLSLRNDPHAMYEIREFAVALEAVFAEHMPTTHRAFCENGRVAP